MNPLLDFDFLVKLNNDRNRTIYAHVISLNQYEHPIEQLEGVVTAGSITIDGSSAVRRVCSLTLSAKNLNINNVYWGIATKVKIEIGLQNNIEPKYDDIIWFKQGIFILTDFKTTQTVNNYTITLSGKDKMCLLNGDISGALPVSTIFDSYDDAADQSAKVGADGKYNFFADNAPAEKIREGFNERYHTDYTYIRNAGTIISITCTLPDSTTNTSISSNAKISFNAFPSEDEWMQISNISNENTKEIQKINNGVTQTYYRKSYDINIDEREVLGFQVKGLPQNTKFEWVINQKIPITIIIQEMLHQYGQEKYSNIIIKDIEPYALEMLDNKTEKDYYLLHDGTSYDMLVSADDLEANYRLYRSANSQGTNNVIIDELIMRNYVEEDDISLIDILSDSTIDIEKRKVQYSQIIRGVDTSKIYTVTPVLQAQVAGYGMTLLVYPEELKGEVGSSVTSILDKIVNMLGDYEYFYDLDGQFIFQAKQTYVKTPWNGTIYLNSENYIEPSELSKKVAYTFDNAVLTTQYQNTPKMDNIKNDYIIWGERKFTNSSSSMKFHGRYAIDNIPLEYTDFNGYTWTANKKEVILKAIQTKIQEGKDKYIRQYDYPEGLSEDWWEINDWANYYQQVFNIDLSKNSSYMREYSWIKKDPSIIADEPGKTEAQVEYFVSRFLAKYGQISSTHYSRTSDVITVTFTDETKTEVKSIYSHGSCTHYYSQFMDLRQLKNNDGTNAGWDYSIVDGSSTTSTIYNTKESKSYILDNGTSVVSWGYHPDYTNSFIYKPILPTDNESYLQEFYTTLLYPDAHNENGFARKYALDYDVDWRELIHIMAMDWYAHSHEDDFEINIRKNNSWPQLGINLFPYGKTGYEQYYIDFQSIQGCWQDIYNVYQVEYDYYTTHRTAFEEKYINEYMAKNDDPELGRAEGIGYFEEKLENLESIISNNTYSDNFYNSGPYKYWHKNVLLDPERLTFWFDFYQADAMGIGKFAVSVIGDRPKTINDSAIKVIIYRDTPDVIYCTLAEYEFYKQAYVIKDGYKYIILGKDYAYPDTVINAYLKNDDILDELLETYGLSKSNMQNDLNAGYQRKASFVRTVRGKSVHEQADKMLYQHSYFNDTVSINNVPIYYLQPNTIISIKDDLSKIIGYYIMNKINISLAYNGMMQITAIKSPERIY